MKKNDSRLPAIVWALLLSFLATAAANKDVKVQMMQGGRQNLTTMPTATWQGNANCIVNLQDTNTHPLAPAPKADEPTIKVTFERDCDDNIFYASSETYTLIDQNGNKQTFFTSNLDWGVNSLHISRGTYDVIAYCQRRDNTAGSSYVVREMVEFTADTTVCINPGEANILIQFEPRLPNGESCIPPITQYSETGEEVVVLGNIDPQRNGFTSGLAIRNLGVAVGSAGVLRRTFVNSQLVDASHQLNFYVNQVSDRFFSFCQFGFEKLNFDRSSYCVYMESSTSKDTIVSNSPEDYVMFEKEFKQSPNGLGTNYGLHPAFSYSIWSGKQGQLSKFEFGHPDDYLSDGEKCYYYFNKSFENDDVDSIQCFVQPGVINAYDENYQGGSLLHTWDPFVALQDGQIVSINQGISCYKEEVYELYPDLTRHYGISHYSQKDRNPAFTYIVDKMKDMSGNSCPILVPKVLSIDYGNNQVEKMLECQKYIGRNGEWRQCDASSINGTVKQNDELIVETNGFYRIGWNNWDGFEGVVDLVLTNSNVDVDGLQGTNQTTIHFSFDGYDDAAPVLHMLDFHDGEDNVIDRFATAADGKFQFYGGDFNEFNNDDQYHNQYYVCSPMASVEVSYSPYQEDNWNELEATEIPELYFSRMGYLYRGTLEGVTGEAYEGWFDLKIKLTDAAGNWQEQVISPAFRIDNLAYTSVATVGSNNAREVARYNLASQRVDGEAKGVVIVKMSDGTARKVIK